MAEMDSNDDVREKTGSTYRIVLLVLIAALVIGVVQRMRMNWRPRSRLLKAADGNPHL